MSTQSEWWSSLCARGFFPFAARWRSRGDGNIRQLNTSPLISLMLSLSSGMYQDVQGQLSHEKTLAHPRASCARLRRVWQGVCGELQAEEAPAGAHGGETFPGGFLCEDCGAVELI